METIFIKIFSSPPSGLSPAQLSELHGNTNLETCRKCQRQYLRDFETREACHVYDHSTSRKCDDPKCRGVLDDSIINFGESLPEGEVKKAFMHAKKVRKQTHTQCILRLNERLDMLQCCVCVRFPLLHCRLTCVLYWAPVYE